VEHVEAQELLSEYLDGELPPPARTDFETHLASCAACRQDVASMRTTLATLARLARAEPPANFLDQVQRKIVRRHSGLPFDLSLGVERKFPFEAVSLVLIGILFALYLLLVALPQERVVGPGKDKPRLLRPDGGVPEREGRSRSRGDAPAPRGGAGSGEGYRDSR
jgi:anti-sigma factor RsiW